MFILDETKIRVINKELFSHEFLERLPIVLDSIETQISIEMMLVGTSNNSGL